MRGVVLISGATTKALGDVAARERDVLQIFAPETPEPGGIAAAPPEGAYFVTRGEGGRLLFTRDGVFALKDGALFDGSGRPVMGYRDNESPLAPLHADPVDAALGFAANARVESDGSVTYDRATIDPRSGRRELQRATLGRIALARFVPGTRLQAVDPEHGAAAPGIAPHVGCAGDGNFPALAPFSPVHGTSDLDRGLQRLQEAYLALDAIRAADDAQRGVDKTAMDLLK